MATLADQCEVDQVTVAHSEVLEWLKAAGLADFALMFAALGVDTVLAALSPCP